MLYTIVHLKCCCVLPNIYIVQSGCTCPVPLKALGLFLAVMVFQLIDTQVELRNACASQARHILAYGGGRSGKTFGFCYCTAIRALSAPTSRHLIARLHNIDVRQAVMMDTWPSMMKKAFPDIRYELNKSDQSLNFWIPLTSGTDYQNK